MKSLLRLLPYLNRYKKSIAIGFFVIIGSNMFWLFTPIIIGKTIDELQQSFDSTTFIQYASLVVGTMLFSGYFSYLTRQTIIVVSRKIEFDLRNDFLSHVQKLPLQYFQNTPTGDLMSYATNDLNAIRSVLGPGIMYTSDTATGFIMILAMMFSLDTTLTLVSLLPLPFISFAVYLLGKRVHKFYDEVQEQYSKLTTRTQENLSGIRVVKSFLREEHEIRIFKIMSWEYLEKNMKLARIQSLLWPLMFMLTGVSIVIVIFFGGKNIIEGTMTLGTMTQFIMYLGMLIWPMIAFGWVVNIFQRGAASMNRFCKVLDTVPEIRNEDFGIQIGEYYNEKSVISNSESQIFGAIEFRNVSFVHKNKTEPVLKNINLKIEQGTTLAIVGKTGCGKTTFVNLIPRLYDSAEGEVLIDGVNVKNIPLEILRNNIAIVPQETFLFSTSVIENISFGTDNGFKNGDTDSFNENSGIRNLKTVIRAAEIARISNDVENFPNQYDTIVGERGITLSGGQKQRTSIARAIMTNPKILILDDAFSAVDTHTEEEILQGLKKFMRERTSIIISHRISTVKDADVIIVLDGGEIVEQGTHSELVLFNGIYTELYEKQMLESELEAI
ncbi:MAG: ABC transporter ATP-binding protein [Ignavibacteria bacterium]|nr:ABC transporter ATP-binding protein [Ignavibacteria bacterium]